MKASEALLLNSLVCGQAKKMFVDENNNRCAMATIMLTEHRPIDIIMEAQRKYHMLAPSTFIPMRSLGVRISHLVSKIMEWNDRGLTRPQIAELLKSYEQRYGEIGPQVPIKLLTHQGGQHEKDVLECQAVDGVYGVIPSHGM